MVCVHFAINYECASFIRTLEPWYVNFALMLVTYRIDLNLSVCVKQGKDYDLL